MLPFLFAVFLFTSAMAVPVPLGHLENARNSLSPPDWRIETIDSAGWVGGYASLALDGNDYPHIGYWDDTNNDVKYAKWNGSAWLIETVDSVGDVGWHTSLALDVRGNPHIGYYDLTNMDLKLAWWNGSDWNIETVDSVGNVGMGTSLALDGKGHPHMSYSNDTDPNSPDLKYAKWNGSAWNIETVDSVIIGCSWTSLALDVGGNPHISYCDIDDPTSFLNLKYAKWNGSAWNIETVDYPSGGALHIGWFSSMVLDSRDYPHISYSYWEFYDEHLRYARWNGSAWIIETVDSVGRVGWFTSIALDSKENPHISYYDFDNADLKYAVWNGSAWNVETVDSDDMVGGFTSIALDTKDYPHIAYFDFSSEDLKYATKAELEPSRSISLDIDPDTLNLKSRGRWVTAYLSAENASVREINVSTVLLQDTLQPERHDYQGDVLMLKFNRQQLQRILPTGESVEIKISGKWIDGSIFEACDYIRVINPAMMQLPQALTSK